MKHSEIRPPDVKKSSCWGKESWSQAMTTQGEIKVAIKKEVTKHFF